MPLTGYLKIDDIAGESLRVDHEDEIDIHDIAWNVSRKSTSKGRRSRARAGAKVEPLLLSKFTDAASPYLLLSCLQGKSFPQMTLSVRKDSGEAHLDYLQITVENVTISRFETLGSGDEEDGEMIEEILGLVFENVTYKYIRQTADHSAGDEHEITFDIAAGA